MAGMARKLDSKRIMVASHNAGKIGEISSLLSVYGIKTLNAAALGLPEPEENGSTYLENALLKAKACLDLTKLAILADDSGIEVEALSSKPGLDTAPFTEKLGGKERVFSLWAGDKRIQENPKAHFICVQVLMWPDGHYEHFFAEVPGRLVFPPRGSGGHGYDPVFIPKGHERTMAEMTFDEKRNISHRFKALAALISACIAPG